MKQSMTRILALLLALLAALAGVALRHVLVIREIHVTGNGNLPEAEVITASAPMASREQLKEKRFPTP